MGVLQDWGKRADYVRNPGTPRRGSDTLPLQGSCQQFQRTSPLLSICRSQAKSLGQVLELPAPKVAILGAQNHKGRENHKGRDPSVSSSRDENSGQMALPSGKHVQCCFT